MDKNEILVEIAKKMNERSNFDIFDVPILEGYNLQENTNKNVLFVAISDDKSIEQLVFDSVLKENENFEFKIDEVVKATKLFMRENGLENPDDNLYYYKDYKANFDFKIYMQNYLKKDKTNFILVKQLNAYFMDPVSRNFYQLSLSTGPLNFLDVNLDEIDKKIDLLLIGILDQVKYKNIN